MNHQLIGAPPENVGTLLSSNLDNLLHPKDLSCISASDDPYAKRIASHRRINEQSLFSILPEVRLSFLNERLDSLLGFV